MRARSLIAIAAASNVLVVLATLAGRGWNAPAAHAAARNSARFSCLWFMLAFAAPGLSRWLSALSAGGKLVHAFVAAHLVHFAVVAALIASFETAHLAQKPGGSAAILIIGFSLVVGAGLTAAPRASRLYTAVHRLTIYFLFLIFFLALARNPFPPLRLMAVPLLLALLLRLSARAAFFRNPFNRLRIRWFNSRP